MPIFEHNYFGDPKEISESPLSRYCKFCRTVLVSSVLHRKLSHYDDEFIEQAIVRMQISAIEKTADPDPDDEMLLQLDLGSRDEDLCIYYCKTCGWWKLVIEVRTLVGTTPAWDFYFGHSAILKPMNLMDISAPLSEISQYLLAKYEDRFLVNPRRMEEVVASVFKQIGYNVYITGFSNDGGIDVVLQDASGELVGVQVKRYNNKVKVEQIRAFAGALLLAGHCRGIFVTTSDFQPAAIKAAEKFSAKGLKIELVNAKKFYDALKIAEQPTFDLEKIKSLYSENSFSQLHNYY